MKQTIILFIINDMAYFLSHRLEIALHAQQHGYEIHLATNNSACYSELRNYSFHFHPLHLSRSGKNIFSEFNSLWQIYCLIKKLKPKIVHLITIKPVIYGGIAAKLNKTPKIIAAIPGLGYMFINQHILTKIVRPMIVKFYKFALQNQAVKVIFQNIDDLNHFIKLKIIRPTQAHLIHGSGVDLEHYNFFSENPSKTKIITMAARLLKDKGIIEFIDACKQLQASGISAKFILAGDFDYDNPSSITPQELEAQLQGSPVQYLGFQKNIHHLFKQSHIIVLPSYREGLPKVLSEAAACGRAIITTNVPGCRDAIIPGVTGILVPPQDPHTLAQAMKQLILDDHLRVSMGIAARKYAEAQFDIKSIVTQHHKLYQEA